MKDFINKLRQLTKSRDRYIKGASIQLLARLQQITDELEKNDPR